MPPSASKLKPSYGKPRLLPFLRTLLDDVTHSDVIRWTDQSEKMFWLVDPRKIAKLWGIATRTLKKLSGNDYRYQFLNATVSNQIDNINNSNLMGTPDSNSTSPTSSESSSGSTSPSGSQLGFESPSTMELLKLVAQFNEFLTRFPMAKEMPMTNQIQLFHEFKKLFPTLFQ